METKYFRIISVGLLCCLSAFCRAGETNANTQIKITLTDGSYITGETRLKEIPISARSLQDKNVSIPLASIRSINVSSNELKISCINGDKIAGTSRINKIEIKSSVGPVAIDLKHISDIYNLTAYSLPLYDKYDGLIGYWPFDGNADDYSGHKLNGTVVGATLTEDRNGRKDSAYEFNGRSDYIEVNNQQVDLTTQISFGAWIYMTGNSGQHRFIIGKNAGSNYIGDFLLTITDNSRFRCHIHNEPGSTGWPIDGRTSLELNKWYHVFATWDGNTVVLYINGEEDLRRTSITGKMTNSNRPIIIGAPDDRREFWFKGKIDDAVIYNKALSPEEVRQIYQFK